MVDLVPDPVRIQSMVDDSICKIAGETELKAAWLHLVATNDVVGIKVFSSPGPNSGTRKPVVEAIVLDLIKAGIPATNIVVRDRHAIDLRIAGYYELQRRLGVRVEGSADAGYDTNVFYESSLLGQLNSSDLEFGLQGKGVGRKSYFSTIVTRQFTKIITVTPLIHHNELGMTGNLYNLATGCVDNFYRFENSPQNLSLVIPEIWAKPVKGEEIRLSDRVVLNITDALICQYQGQNLGLLHYSAVLNQLRFSRDPVALDILSSNEITLQRSAAGIEASTNTIDLYHNASLLELGFDLSSKINVEKIHEDHGDVKVPASVSKQ